MKKAQQSINPLIVEIKNRFSDEHWPWIIQALRQDSLTWETITSSELGARALQTLGDQPQNWSPASLALLSLNSPVGIESLKTLPLRPLAVPIRKKTNLAYEQWLANPKEPLETLQQAGLLALGLREQRINDSWENLCSHLDRKASGLPSVLACLYGMIPDPFDLLRAFLHPDTGLFNPDLVVHIVLSNPTPAASQYDIFRDLMDDLPLPQRLVMLDLLNEQRPSVARELATHILETQTVSLQRLENAVASAPENSLSGWSKSLTLLDQVLQATQVYQHSSQAEPAMTLLNHANTHARRFQAYLAAQLALAAAGHGECGLSLEAWKQATQLEPENSAYAAQLAQALMESNRLTDAQAYLTARKMDQAQNDHPALLIIQAQLTHQTGKPAEIQLAAQQAYLALAKLGREGVSNQQLFALANLLFAHDLPKETVHTAQIALGRQPEQADFLGLLAQAHLAAGSPAQALSAAVTAQALQPEAENLLRLTIECLEANQAWQAALAERQNLLTSQQPLPADLRALASCALKAGKPEEAAGACQLALEIDAQDGLSYALLGEANLLMGNTQAALDYFHQATELAPNQSAPWLALAEAHQKSGENQRALEVLRAASMAAPNSPEIHLALGQASLAENAPTQALNALRRAAALIQSKADEQKTTGKSPSVAVQTELANQIALHLGQTLHRLGHLDEAGQVLGDAYRSIIRSPKTNSALAYAYAKALLDLNELQKAIQPLHMVIESHPVEPEPYLDLARTLLQVDDCSIDEKRQAIDCLHQVLELQPKHAEAQALLAEAYMTVGELNHAMDAYRLALESEIASQPAWKARLAHGLGKTALGLNQTETALAVLQEAAQMEPLNPQIQRSLSEGYLTIHLYEEGIRTARTALQLNPADVENLVWFADQALRLQQESGGQLQVRGEAINALIQSTQIAPDNAGLHIRLGQVYLQAKDPKAGQQAFEKVAAIANNRANAVSSQHLYQAARELRQLGEPATAINLLERAVQTLSERKQMAEEPCGTAIGPAVIWAELAGAHCQAGHYQAALESLDQAIAINPKDPDLLVVKADLYQELDDLQSALHCLAVAIELAPERAELYLKTASILPITGAYQQALEQAEKALTLVETSQGEAEASENTDPALAKIDLAARNLAAELARGLLQPEKAIALLANAPVSGASGDDLRRYHAQRAELALDHKDDGNATDALAILSELAPNHPRVLALQTRMAIRRGDLQIGNQLLNQSLRWVPPSEGTRITNEPELRTIQRAQAQAAIESGQWTIALSLLRRVAEACPQEPLGQLQYGRALALRAEAQSTAQALDVIQHAPGSIALSEDAYLELETALKTAEENTPETSSESFNFLDDTAAAIARWKARGQAIFKASTQSAILLENILEGLPAGPEDIAARIVNLGSIGEHTAASKAAQAYPRHPLVWMRLAANLAYSNPQQAKLAASRALEFWPNQAHAHLYELPILHALNASLAQRTGDLTQARQSILSALEAWPDEPRWHALAAEICLSQSQAIDLEESHLEDPIQAAIDHLQEATRLEPDFYHHHLRLGQVFLQERDHQSAIEALTRASQINIEQPEVWISLSQAHLGAEDLAQAASCAERAIECASDPTEALLLRGEIALRANNPRGALTRAQTVLREQPEEPSALFLQARALEEMGRPAEALETIEQLIALVEANPLIELEKARLLRQAKGLPAALEAYHKLASDYPDEAIIQAPLARALMDAGQSDEAISVAQSALQNGANHLKPEDAAYLHRMLGRQARRVGQLDQAIHHLSSAVEESPGDIEAYLELGNAYQERRQYGEALEVYERATYINRDDHRPYFLAGQVLKENKDYASAEEMLRRAAELAPDDLSVHRLLGAVVALNLVHNRRPTQTQI
jgi:tetratricopeptide (TPR) repeat protein